MIIRMQEILDYQFIEKLKGLSFVDEIWMFGSRARGDNQKKSDIDLAIMCPDATDYDWMRVTDIIEDSDTLLKIDCIRMDKDKMNKELYENILKDKLVIYVKKHY